MSSKLKAKSADSSFSLKRCRNFNESWTRNDGQNLNREETADKFERGKLADEKEIVYTLFGEESRGDRPARRLKAWQKRGYGGVD